MSLSDPVVIVGLAVVFAIAVVGLFRPFLGLVVLILIRFVQPAGLVPALAPFRVELVYALLLLFSYVVHRTSTPTVPPLTSPILRASLILLGYATLTVPFAIWRGGALDQVIFLAKLVFILFFIATLIDTNFRLRSVVWVLVGLLAWYAGSAMHSYLQGVHFSEQDLERAAGVTSIVGDPNALAGLIVGLLPFLIAAIRFTRMMAARLLLLSVFPLALATLIVTGSRASILALAAVGIYFVFHSKHKALSFVCFVALACVTWVGMPEQYQQRFLSPARYAGGDEMDASNELRIRIWKAGWRMFLDHPVLGVGAGQFSTAYGTVYSGVAHGPWMQPHNLLIQVGCELGLVGLVIFGYFVFQIVKANRSLLQLKGKGQCKLNYEVAVACGALLAGVAVVSVFGHTLYRPYWYLLGGLVGANRFLVDAA
ncbi:MAG: O-antigen ligase family protein, partial [Acidobacteriia bacterium]|nr:O-antigen ligase family protein [Terriglobia bacterium]